MSTGLSSVAASLRSKPLSEFGWWKHHVVFFALLFVGLPALLTVTYGLSGLYSYLGINWLVLRLANLVMFGLIGTVAITAIGAVPGYYYDAKYLKANDLPYEPHWVAYILVHMIPFVGPFVAIPVYVMQRYRHAGIPVSELFQWVPRR